MAKATVRIPHKTDLETMCRLAIELDTFAFHEHLTLDFGEEPMFFSPFYMLFVSAKLRALRRANPELRLEIRNHLANPYPGNMGFYDMFGLDIGRQVGEAWGSENYLPMTCVSRESLYENPTDKYIELPDLIQRHANRIASIITRDDPKHKNMFDVLSFSIREVMRNVFEHSTSDSLYYCLQYWPKSNKVEFALADFGIGVRRGLSENPNFRFTTDKEAVEYSMLPSVSGKTHLPRSSNTWFNSGYGLYMTSRLARNGGNFVLASGSTAVHLSRKTKNNYRTGFSGTALRVNLDVDQIGDVQDRLQQFRKEGHQAAQSLSGTGNRPPSAMSLLLRRDFT